MTSILMWLFANDFGLFSDNIIMFRFLFFSIIFLFIFFISEKYVKPVLFVICLNFVCLCFVWFISFKIFPEYIPQYGTESQKEMLLLCLKHEKNNELSKEEQKHISTTINNIMETCYVHHLNDEQYAKKLLEEQKQELKDKEVLDSLNKMMANQGYSN